MTNGITVFPGGSPLNTAIALSERAEIVRSSLANLDVARSLHTGITVVKKFGRNTAVGTSFAPVALGGVYNTPQAAAATTLRIKAGGGTTDTAAGAGAREVTLVGLDETWAEATEAVATAGASASSATTTTFTRLYRAYVSSSGTYATSAAGSHESAITIENGAGGTDWATISATDFPHSQTEIGAYSVPTGYTGYVFLDDVISETTSKTADIVFFWRAGNDDTAAPYSAMRVQAPFYGLQQGIVDLSGKNIMYGPYVGPCDIGFMAKVDSATGSVSAEFEIYLVNE